MSFFVGMVCTFLYLISGGGIKMKYKLKNQYRLGVANNCNYILSDQGEECVYLNPYVAFVLNRLFTGSSVEDVASVLSAINCFSIEKATEVVLKIVQRLANYIEPSHTLSITKTEDEIDILNRSKTFLCPVTKEKAPRKIKFYLTDYCPRRCIYCFAGAKFTNELIENKEFLSVDRFKEIIMEAAAIGVSNIEISGGDPFIIKNIDEYLKVMIDYFPNEWGTSTKTYVSEGLAKKLSEIGLKEMQVSIDSHIPETVDKLLGVGNAFNEVIATIHNLINAGIEVTTKSVITSLNIYDIPETIRFLVKLGVKYLRFSYYYISANRHSDTLYPTNEQFAWLNNEIPALLNYLKENNVGTDLTTHELYQNAFRGDRVICGGFTGSMSVRFDGAVMFCDSLNHCDDFAAGNLKRQGILEAWNSKELSNFNDPAFFKEKYLGTKCYTCNIFDNCFYRRCYVRSFQKYGNYFDVDPACPFGEEDYIIR